MQSQFLISLNGRELSTTQTYYPTLAKAKKVIDIWMQAAEENEIIVAEIYNGGNLIAILSNIYVQCPVCATFIKY